MRGRRERIEDLNCWPSIADFMLALFMIALILGLTNLTLFYSQQPSNVTEGLIGLCKDELDKCKNKRIDLEKKPPNIEYTAKDGLTFESNSADTISFKDFLAKDTNGFLNWKDNIIKIHPEVNTIEIIGHTDDRKVTSVGNFDESLPRALSGDLQPHALKSGSNADLGLWRAVAVMQQWKEWVNDLPEDEEKKRLQELDVRCYSAAYGIPPKNLQNLQGDSLKAISRRIEIRFTELKK